MPLDISEYREIAADALGNVVQAGREPALATQSIAITGGSTQSAVFGDNVTLVRLHTDVACRIAFGANPTASASSPRMAAGQTEFFGVRPGHRVAVVSST